MIDAWEEKLRAALGTEAVSRRDAGGDAPDLGLPLEITPPDRQSLQEALRVASAAAIPMVPAGGGAWLRAAVPEGPACRLSLARFDRIVQHEPADFTITAQAGLSLARAQEHLLASSQQLPFSATDPTRASLGGIVATGWDGPLAHTYGRIRDQVLGVEIVHGDGRHTRAGGQVVKNVTGYDLCRLYTASRGVLGVITQLSFRLRPVEPQSRTLSATFPDLGRAWRAGMLIREEVPRAFAIHVLADDVAAASHGAAPARLALTLRGVAPLVAALKDDCCRLLGPALSPGAAPEIADEDGDTFLREVSSLFGLRIAVLPADGERLLALLGNALPEGSRLALDVSTGVCDLATGPAGLDLDRERALGESLAPLGAQVDIPADPRFHARRYASFPSTRPTGDELTRALMQAFDPAAILNAHRHELRA
jgi:FAD/FMN-containing dehydrogenase